MSDFQDSNILKWLYWSQGGAEDRVQLIRAAMNCMILGRVELKKCFLITGEPGGIGKSTFIRLLVATIGERNHAPISMNGIGKNTSTALRIQKRLITIPPTSKCSDRAVRLLHLLVNQEPLEFKGRSFRLQGTVFMQVEGGSPAEAKMIEQFGDQCVSIRFDRPVSDSGFGLEWDESEMHP